MPTFTVILPIDLYPDQTGLTLSGQFYNTANVAVGAALVGAAGGFHETGLGYYEWTGAIDTTFVGRMEIRNNSGGALLARAVVNMPQESISIQTALIGAAPVSFAPDSGGAFDPVAVQSAVYWSLPFLATGLNTTGWTRFAFTVKRNPDAEDDAEALLSVKVTNPADAANDGILVYNRRAVAPADAMRTKGGITIEATNPNTIARVTLLPEALVVPPSPSSDPYTFEIDYWLADGIKRQLGRGDFAVKRSVRRGTGAP
jgi:hypothetical protein